MSSPTGRHHSPPGARSARNAPGAKRSTAISSFWRYSRRAIALVWSTHRALTVASGVLTLAAGVMPAGVAYLGKLIVDAVVAALAANQAGGSPDYAHGALARGLRRLARRSTRRRAARHQFLPIAAARAAVAARALLDPRQGADADARAIRGLGALRQAESRAAGSVDQAAVAREPHLRARPEWRSRSAATPACCSRSRRGPSRSSSPRVCRRSSPRRGSRASAFARFSGAAPTAACWRTSRSSWRARTMRKRSSCSSSVRGCWRAIARSFGASTTRRNGSRSGATAGASCSGSSAAPRSTAPTRGSRSQRSTATISLGEMTMYLLLFKQGQSAVAAMLGADRRHVRGQPLSLESLRLPRAAVGRRAWGRDERRRAARRHRVRQRHVHLSRRDRRPRCATSRCTYGPARASRSSARTAPARRRS